MHVNNRMRIILKYIKRTIIFFILTILTQVGGVVYLASLWIAGKINYNIKLKSVSVFIILYLITTFLFIPLLAPIGGRERIINTDNLRPVNYLTVLLNRNYVTPELKLFLLNLSESQELINHSIQVRYLDACFPFFKGFPLLPHLSHYDGKKIDLSFIYESENGDIVNKSKSISGYGVFEGPHEKEFNQTNYCKGKGYFQYDYPKYLTFGKINKQIKFSEWGTKILIRSILHVEGLEKIFIEPHLKQRLGFTDNRIRFQGCKAVRHDDHIHIQLN